MLRRLYRAKIYGTDYNYCAMDPPQVQFVTTSDGYNIAYAVSGRGTPLIFLPGTFYHVQLAWEFPGLKDWLQGLAERFQLIQFDPRGTGMSSRDVRDDHTEGHYQRDIDAVVGRLKLERFFFMAASRGVDLATDYALKHPEHVIALIFGTSGTGNAQEAVFRMLPQMDWGIFVRSMVPRDRSIEEGERIVELTKQASDQRNYLLRWRAFDAEGDLEPRLDRLLAPTLVMHSRDYVFTPIEAGMRVAQHSGGRFVILDGSDAWGRADQGLRAIETFLADVATEYAPEVVDRGPHPKASYGLSPRQREVLRLLGQGKTNHEIAEELVLSERTIQRHIANIYERAKLRNRSEATAFALGLTHSD